MSNNNFRVLKLRSGENIMGKLVDSNKKTIKIDNPMEVKQLHHIDGYGRKVESIVLSEWLRFTEQNDFAIQKDFILGIFNPTRDLISTYEMQKERNNISKQDVKTPNPFSNLAFFFRPPTGMGGLEGLLRGVEQQMNESENLPEDHPDYDSEEFIQNLINGKHNDERTIDEESDPNYGSNYCDWSPDISDYI
jgi:hypothetical protein